MKMMLLNDYYYYYCLFPLLPTATKCSVTLTTTTKSRNHSLIRHLILLFLLSSSCFLSLAASSSFTDAGNSSSSNLDRLLEFPSLSSQSSSSSPRRRVIRSKIIREETSFAFSDIRTGDGHHNHHRHAYFDLEQDIQESILAAASSSQRQKTPLYADEEDEPPSIEDAEKVKTRNKEEQKLLPRFLQEQASPRNVTAQVGHPIYLHCVVESSLSGDKMVSWIRLRDFHLLTVGLFTYTPDDRFVMRQGVSSPTSSSANDWSLNIKHVLPSDEGTYECQVNTDPPRSQYYFLRVLMPETKMMGSGADMFVRAGAPLSLTCQLTSSPSLPTFVFWYQNDRMINYELEEEGRRGSISIEKDPVSSDALYSRLVIRSARLNDSGNYSCHFVGSTSVPAYVYVHVLQGERRQSGTESVVQNDQDHQSMIVKRTSSSSSSSSSSSFSPSSTLICHLLIVSCLHLSRRLLPPSSLSPLS